MARSVLAAAGMAALLAAACTGTALAANPTFSPNSSAGQQAAASDAAASASAADVWVASSVEVSSDSYMDLDFANEDVPYFIQSSSAGYMLIGSDGAALGEAHGYIGEIFTSEMTSAPYFCVQDEEGLNKQAIMDASGQVVSDYAYADFSSSGEHWVCAIAVAVAQEGAEYDYTSGDSKLVIDHVDLFHDGTFVATLDRASYGSPVAVDDYLVVPDLDHKTCTVYSAGQGAVNQIPKGFWSADDEYYSADDGTLRFISGAQVGTADCALTYDDVTNPYLVGADGVSIYDIYGTQVVTLGFQVNELNAFMGDYAVVWGKDASGNLKYGVLDRDWNLVVALEYDRIGANYSNVAFEQGYCYVEQGDKFGFLRADGSVAVPVEYSVATQKFQGDLFCVIAGATGYQVVSAASGLLDAVYSDVYTAHNGSGSPLLQAADANGLWGLVDWRGSTLIDFAFEYSFYMTPDATGSLVLLNSGNNAYQILSIANSISVSYDDQIDDLMPAEGEMPAVADGQDAAAAAEEPAAEAEPAASGAAATEAPAAEADFVTPAPAGDTDSADASQAGSASSAVSAAASLLGMAASALSGK